MHSWTSLHWTSAKVQTCLHCICSVSALFPLVLTANFSLISDSLAWLCSACFTLFPLYVCVTVPILAVPWICYVYSCWYSKMVEHQWFSECKHIYKQKCEVEFVVCVWPMALIQVALLLYRDTDCSNNSNLCAYQDRERNSVCSALTSPFAEDRYL